MAPRDDKRQKEQENRSGPPQSVSDDDENVMTGYPSERPTGFPLSDGGPPFPPGSQPPWASLASDVPVPSLTFVTSAVSNDRQSTSSEQPASVTSTSSTLTRPEPPSSSTDAEGFGDDSLDDVDGDVAKELQSNHKTRYAMAGVVPVVMIFIIGALVFFCLRSRRRRRERIAFRPRGQHMKTTVQPSMQPYFAPPPIQTQYMAPPSHLPLPVAPTAPQPVILGPISSGNNGTYLTGMDTSDLVSVNDRPVERTGLGDPFADRNSIHEEPPPPYRPRSIVPLSRDTNLREPSLASRAHLFDEQNRPRRSPFEDPRDDDTVSEISGHALRRNHEVMSVVSDLSYQEDPVVGRPRV